MIDSQNYWAINPLCVADAHRKIAAYLGLKNGLTAGPADAAEREGLPIRVIGSIAVIPIMGPMMRRGGWMAEYFGMCCIDRIVAAVMQADADPDIETIILHIDSPGGSVSGLDLLSDAIAKSGTKVVAQVDGMAASAAYWVASQANELLMGRNDLVGSIGVKMMLYDLSAYYENMGIKAIPIDTGEHKSAGAEGTEITEEQQAEYQKIVNYYFDDFVNAVSSGRGMPEAAVRAVGDGRVFTAADAQSLGLADGVATFDETFLKYRTIPKAITGRSTQAARARLKI
jgi:signal peptide peptidase SppA